MDGLLGSRVRKVVQRGESRFMDRVGKLHVAGGGLQTVFLVTPVSADLKSMALVKVGEGASRRNPGACVLSCF